MKDMSMKISMSCPICGNDQFSGMDVELDALFDAPDDSRVKCADCGNIITKKDLLEANRSKISANVEDFKKDILKEAEKEIRKIFKQR